MRQQTHPNMAVLLLFSCFYVVSVSAQTSPNCLNPSGPQLNQWDVEYSDETGKCYYSVKTAVRQTYNMTHSAAQTTCSNLFTATPNGAHLPQIKTIADENFLVKFLFRKGYGVDIWTSSVCNTANNLFIWPDNTTVVRSPNCTTGDLMMFKISYSYPEYIAQSSFVKVTGGYQIFMCEYDAPKCDPSVLSGWDAVKMTPSVTPNIGTDVKIKCAKGYFRENEKAIHAATATYTRNRFNCTYIPPTGAGFGTAQWIVQENSVLDACQPMHCKGWKLINETIIPDVNATYKDGIDVNKHYLYGEKISVQCFKGYVNYLNASDVNAFVKCGQNELDPSVGQWEPYTLVVCNPVRCVESMPLYNTSFMTTYKAFDRIKNRNYLDSETNRFPFFPNTVYIKCATRGYFFADRKYDKTFQCQLPANGSLTIGVWVPVEDTIASVDVMYCKPISCLTKEIVILSAQNDMQNYLKSSSNFQVNVTIADSYEVSTTVSMETFVQQLDYPYERKITFRCKEGYEMTDKNNMTRVLCDGSGTWDKKIAACIKQSGELDVAKGKKYIPPAKEAGQAASLGVVVIVIVVMFFVAILILDLTTLSRDLKLMKRNLKRIKDRSTGKKTS